MVAMLVWLVPIFVGTMLVRRSRAVAASLPPAVAVVILSTAALLTAATTGFVLAVAAFTAAATIPAVAHAALWSQNVAVGAPPLWVGAVAAVTVAWLALASLRRFLVAGRSMAFAGLACRGLPATDRLVVLDDERPDAYAVQGLPGLPGRAVVSTGMLRALTPIHRRVLLAHEDAHLRGHHQLFVQAVELAAAANPLLRPGVDVIRDAVERWADETAATHIGDRAVVARAVAQAAFAKSRNPAPVAPAVLPVAASAVAARARAMLSPAPRPRRLLAAAIALLALSPALSALGVGHTAEAHFEQARAHCALDANHRCSG